MTREPNEALNRIRKLAKNTADTELATQIVWLDNWLSAGGYLPEDWYDAETQEDHDRKEGL